MASVLSTEVLQDDLAVSLARAVAAANTCARQSGIDVTQRSVSITQQIANGDTVWRISYVPTDYLQRRGGDFTVEVDSTDATVRRVLRGQ